MQYNNPVPVAVCLVLLDSAEDTPRFLAVRRGIMPRKGELAFPGGYIDQLESAEHAASREMLEETGVVLPSSTWKTLCTRITAENRLLIFMLAQDTVDELVLEQFVPNREVESLHAVTVNDTLAFPTHDEVLKSTLLRAALNLELLPA